MYKAEWAVTYIYIYIRTFFTGSSVFKLDESIY